MDAKAPREMTFFATQSGAEQRHHRLVGSRLTLKKWPASPSYIREGMPKYSKKGYDDFMLMVSNTLNVDRLRDNLDATC